MKLLLATNNKHKVNELKEMLNSSNVEVFSLADLNIKLDVVEDGSTFTENALKKATEIYKYLNDDSYTVIADDSGLSVDALNGAPGIYSARYSGGNDSDNNKKLLSELKDVPEGKRNAHFTCVIALVNKDITKTFEGICEGTIAFNETGDNKFGYDPVFYYPPKGLTFGEMEHEEKNKVSHRAMALKKLKEFLENN
ncbi:MAG: XTP/dITP diphosphatase [Clostridia bacterium]|nr:XTP/dITP diphosphatase [Clostridia bacterium]